MIFKYEILTHKYMYVDKPMYTHIFSYTNKNVCTHVDAYVVYIYMMMNIQYILCVYVYIYIYTHRRYRGLHDTKNHRLKHLYSVELISVSVSPGNFLPKYSHCILTLPKTKSKSPSKKVVVWKLLSLGSAYFQGARFRR